MRCCRGGTYLFSHVSHVCLFNLKASAQPKVDELNNRHKLWPGGGVPRGAQQEDLEKDALVATQRSYHGVRIGCRQPETFVLWLLRFTQTHPLLV
jgi:hypothetical protein